MSSLRISGFSSGLDIDAMVKTLMKAERAKLNKLTQQQTTLEWQREDYRSISTSLVDFRNNKLSNYSMSSMMGTKKAEVSGNASAVSVTSTASTASGSLNVTVNRLATSANTVVSLDSTKLASAAGKTIAINGKDIITLTGSESMDDLVKAINGNKDANVTALYDSTSGKLSLTSKTTGTGTITLDGDFSAITKSIDPTKTMEDLGLFNTGKMTINGIEITYAKTESVNDIVNKINNTANVGVMASVSDGKIKFVPNNTSNSVSLGGDASSFPIISETSGQNALVNVNGLDMEYASNNINVNGIGLQLKQVSTSGSSTISVGVDVDAILNTVKSFVNDYNTLIAQVNKKLDEQRYLKYSPLTDDEKENMKESEIELWQTKARSGLLHNDSTLSTLLSSLRMTSTAPVDTGNSAITSINSIGITTGQWSDKGKLVIQDEAKLKAAIEADPDAVMKLFTAMDTNKAPNSTTSGIFTKMSESVLTGLKSLSSKAGTSLSSTDTNGSFMNSSTIGNQLRDLDTRIARMNTLLTNKENQYYKQFTAMESAMNKYQSQSSSFSS